jgi:hypothetical protein
VRQSRAVAFGRLSPSKACFFCASFALAAAGSAASGWADETSATPAKEWKPLLVGGWQLSPALFAGAIYNSNVDARSTNPDASWGVRVVPAINADLDNGIYKTHLYGVGNFTGYANSDVGNKATIDAKVGVMETYAPTPDLTFQFGGDYTRALNVFGSADLATINNSLLPSSAVPSTPSAPFTPTVVAPQANTSNRYNQFSGLFSVLKKLGRTFFGLSGSAVATQYDGNSNGLTSPDGVTYTVTGRAGFDITPQLYAFVDPSVNWQRYSGSSQNSQSSSQNSQGYRITAGVGTSKEGIWTGEVYGGYQVQDYDVGGDTGRPVFGFRIGYSPTRMWVFQASLDENFNAAAAPTNGTNGANVTNSGAAYITTALLNVQYKGLPPDWSTSARFGYVRSDYFDIGRTDNGWLAGVNVRYAIWRNLGLTLDYQFTSLDSGVANQSYDQHMVSIGASYRY